MTPQERIAVAFERMATALEQIALEAPESHAEPPWPAGAPTELPPMAAPALCPVHRQPWKTVPAGVSKKTGNPYSAFQACPERGCNQRHSGRAFYSQAEVEGRTA